MRLYGKKFLRQKMDLRSQSRQETRDAIVWGIDATQRLVQVKIQGSNELIYAHYPENREAPPNWLKKGNAVKIMHTQGVRGRIEVVGHGQCIPTPVTGDTFPTPDIPPDCVLTGCSIIQVPNNPKMVVFVEVGTFRIAGVTYSLGPIAMLVGDYFQLGDGGAMDKIAGAKPINTAPSSGYYRYDLLCIASDLVIDYVAGTPATSSPVQPTIPTNHVKLGDYILIPYGRTKIETELIGLLWSTPFPSFLTMTIADDDLAYGENETTITIQVLDQYDNPLTTGGYGWYITLEIIGGNGYVSSAEEGESATKIGAHTLTGSSYTFGYRRDGGPGDQSPALLAKLEIDHPLQTSGAILVHTTAS